MALEQGLPNTFLQVLRNPQGSPQYGAEYVRAYAWNPHRRIMLVVCAPCLNSIPRSYQSMQVIDSAQTSTPICSWQPQYKHSCHYPKKKQLQSRNPNANPTTCHDFPAQFPAIPGCSLKYPEPPCSWPPVQSKRLGVGSTPARLCSLTCNFEMYLRYCTYSCKAILGIKDQKVVCY